MAKVSIDGQVYEYDTNRMLNTEAIALQKVTGMKFAEWSEAMGEGDPYALTGLVWLLWRREGRTVPFDEVEFDLNSLDILDDEQKPDEEQPDPTEAGEPAGENPA